MCRHPFAVDQVAAIPSVSLRPLEGIRALDSLAASSRPCDGAALAALLKLCSGWQKPGAALRGQCILVSRSKFMVDILYHPEVISAFKQMPTKNYGTKGLTTGFPNGLFGVLKSPPRLSSLQTRPHGNGAFHWRITGDWVSNAIFSFLFVSRSPSCLTMLCFLLSGFAQWGSRSGGGASSSGSDPGIRCQVWWDWSQVFRRPWGGPLRHRPHPHLQPHALPEGGSQVGVSRHPLVLSQHNTPNNSILLYNLGHLYKSQFYGNYEFFVVVC